MAIPITILTPYLAMAYSHLSHVCLSEINSELFGVACNVPLYFMTNFITKMGNVLYIA